MAICSVRSAVVGAGTGHLPYSRTHATVTNPRLGQTYASDSCFWGGVFARGQMSDHVMLTSGHGLWMTATAAVGPQCWAMRDVSIIGSWLKSTKLPELWRGVGAPKILYPTTVEVTGRCL